MLILKYKGLKTEYRVEFSKINDNIVQIIGSLPFKTNGFTLSREGKEDNWNYLDYTTVYRELDNGVQFSNDGSVYTEPVPTVTFTHTTGGSLEGTNIQKVSRYEDLVIPTPIALDHYIFDSWNIEIPTEGDILNNKVYTAIFSYVPTLDEVKEQKIKEMNETQQQVIQQGISVMLSDGSIEHFTLTDHDQTSLMGLQVQVAQGVEQIPWHTSDHSDHCKYYSNEDMNYIVTAAMQHVTYHVTYFRDLRIWINSLSIKEDVQSIAYGDYIPKEYQSEVLKDLYAALNITE